MSVCTVTENHRRRLFWATQPDACGSETRCGSECGSPGLSFVQSECDGDPACNPLGCLADNEGVGRQISTEGWISGLVINMLMTDGREPDSERGFFPGSQGGHWSESYITGSTATVGTLVRTAPPTGSTSEMVANVTAFAQATLDRLVERGVAVSVEVVGTYAGSNRVHLDVTVYGQNCEETKVGLSGTRLTNGWIWS